MKTDFDDGSSKFGLQYNEFKDLSDNTKKKLKKLISRIMERAYRRGVQQALVLNENNAIDEWIKNDLHKFRYGKSLQKSIGLDGFVTTSQERLDIEESLDTVGL